jgi:hypothetical protein
MQLREFVDLKTLALQAVGFNSTQNVVIKRSTRY